MVCSKLLAVTSIFLLSHVEVKGASATKETVEKAQDNFTLNNLDGDSELLRERGDLGTGQDEQISLSIREVRGKNDYYLFVTQGNCVSWFQISARDGFIWRLFLLLVESSVVQDFINRNASYFSRDSMTCPAEKPKSASNFLVVNAVRKTKGETKKLICEAYPGFSGIDQSHQSILSGFQLNGLQYVGDLECSDENCHKYCREASERNFAWRKMARLLMDADDSQSSKPFRFSVDLLKVFMKLSKESGNPPKRMVLGGECAIISPSVTRFQASIRSGICPKLEDLNGKYIADMRQDEEALEMNLINNRIAPIYSIQCPGNIRYFFFSELENVETSIGLTQRALICRRAEAAVTL